MAQTDINYRVGFFASDNEITPEHVDATQGNKVFEILGFRMYDKPIGKFWRSGDGSGRSPKQVRKMFVVKFTPFEANLNKPPKSDDFYKDINPSLDLMPDIDWMIRQPYFQISGTDYPLYQYSGTIEQAVYYFSQLKVKYSLPRRVTWDGKARRGVDEDTGTETLELTFEDYYPAFLPKPDPRAGDWWNDDPLETNGGPGA